MDFLSISMIILWIFVLGLSVLVFVMLKQTRDFLSRLTLVEGMEMQSSLHIGDLAPGYTGLNHMNEKVKVGENNKKSLLLFTNNNCGVCQEIINKMGYFNTLGSLQNYQFYIISGESKSLDTPLANLDYVHFVADSKPFTTFEITHVPTIFLLDEQRTIEFKQILSDPSDIDSIFNHFIWNKKNI